MSEVAERNRRIKWLLGDKYGRDKVRVKGGRGTAYGWVDVALDISPESIEAATALHDEVLALIKGANIELDTRHNDEGELCDKIIITSRRDKIVANTVDRLGAA